jgi:hypothetical protein
MRSNPETREAHKAPHGYHPSGCAGTQPGNRANPRTSRANPVGAPATNRRASHVSKPSARMVTLPWPCDNLGGIGYGRSSLSCARSRPAPPSRPRGAGPGLHPRSLGAQTVAAVWSQRASTIAASRGVTARSSFHAGCPMSRRRPAGGDRCRRGRGPSVAASVDHSTNRRTRSRQTEFESVPARCSNSRVDPGVEGAQPL